MCRSLPTPTIDQNTGMVLEADDESEDEDFHVGQPQGLCPSLHIQAFFPELMWAKTQPTKLLKYLYNLEASFTFNINKRQGHLRRQEQHTSGAVFILSNVKTFCPQLPRLYVHLDVSRGKNIRWEPGWEEVLEDSFLGFSDYFPALDAQGEHLQYSIGRIAKVLLSLDLSAKTISLWHRRECRETIDLREKETGVNTLAGQIAEDLMHHELAIKT